LRILLADDDLKVRSALRLLLEQDTLTNTIEEVENTEKLIEWTAQGEADLVLLDWYLPGLHQPAHVFAYLRQNSPGLKIVAMGPDTQSRQIALALGADVFISKSDPPEELIKAINECRSVNGQN
jgi:two-component system, NarL family, invasion response regulator UvrY